MHPNEPLPPEAGRACDARKSPGLPAARRHRAMVSAALGLLTASCSTSADRPLGGLEVVSPRASQGVVWTNSAASDLDQLDRQLRSLERPPALLSQAPSPDPAASIPELRSLKPVQERARPSAVPGAARLLDLPRMNRTELAELVGAARLRLQAESGFEEVPTSAGLALPAAPEGLTGLTGLMVKEGGAMRVMRLGYHPFLTQPSRFWVEGLRRSGAEAPWEADPGVGNVVEMVQGLVLAVDEGKKELNRDDLEFRVIQISYIDVEGALEALKGFGIETADSVGKVTLPVAFSRLPIVGRMPSPDGQKTALLGADSQKATAFDLSMSPSMATTLPADPNMARSSQVLVYFHPAHPEQFTRVQKLLREVIDRPARQIFIEGLVLEISEQGLKELGVDWKYQNGGLEVGVGDLFPGLPALGNLSLNYGSLANLEEQWIVRLRALVEDEKAEVLSRPSVLTLNNRQATIRVGQEIPIATSQESSVIKDVNRVAFSFKYLPTGISLNIRPRITEEGNEVSMLVDTVVSAAIPGADLELRSNSGEVLASAPTVATRRVQTYTRIGNNTPFIIGGLVNREFTTIRRKVPLLGDIPYLGNLFRSRSTKNRKQEVIIVLTPHVLPEEISERAWGRYLPRDDDKFDDVGNNLFRASYRIREEDVFDLSFLDRNESLNRYRGIVRRLVDQNFRLAEQTPFNQFLDGRTPGEHVLVERMIYEVIKRLSEKTPGWLDRRIARDRLIFFSGQNAGGYDVQFLEPVLAHFGDGMSGDSFFRTNSGKALAIVYRQGRDAIETGSLTRNPIPEISLVDCPDRAAWGELLWEWNQPDAEGRPRFTMLIHQPEDLVRLQRAVLLREIINLNGGPVRVNRKNFSLGQVLLVPDENPHETRLLDGRAAGHFFHTEHYYAATLQRIQKAIEELDRYLAETSSAVE